ncbi:hypothetical protein E2C01_099284 [Portunus trituberculatus]|uniref:Uncharacterized protein n=1 Tax=Portunus trituberculatus TaxID=210409 RepID=A0A5B7K3G8_PORTR|nr:hypothetical protein [Portunus trituberculatus]
MTPPKYCRKHTKHILGCPRSLAQPPPQPGVSLHSTCFTVLWATAEAVTGAVFT